MKNARKLMALLLALVVVLSLSVTAFATGTGSITVDNPQAGQTYTAYKIFDVVYDTKSEDGETVAGDHYAYTIENDSEWFTAVKAYAAVADNKLTLTQVTGTTTYVVTTEDGFSAASFAAALNDAKDGKTGKTLTGDKPTANNLPLGYYFVTSTSGALCNLTTTNPSVTIYDKNVTPPLEKTDDAADVEIGQKVNYELTGEVPSTTGYTTYTYKISDTMSAGLTFNKDVVVKIGETVLTSNYTLNNRDNGFDLTIDVMKFQTQVGAVITVNYSATVNKNAIGEIVNNKATLTYSNDPKDGTTTVETPGDEETVYSAKIVIDKHQTGSDTTKLPGAKFKLYKMEGTDKKYFKCDRDTKVVTWVAVAEATEVTTDTNGAAEFEGLKNGTYYLEETAAPAGYNKLTGPVEIVINNGESTTKEALIHTEHVGNNTGAMLPATGGMGTTLFYVIGSILLLGAAVLLITKKRMGAAK